MSKKQIFYCFQKALILGKSVIWGFWCTFCQDGVSFMILYSMTENKLRGISHGVPSHHSHSLNLPRSLMTQSQRFCLCECVCVCACVCVNICMPARQGSTIKRTVRETTFLIANTQLSLSLRLTDGGQSATFTFRTLLWQTQGEGWGNKGSKKDKKETNQHKQRYGEMLNEVGEKKMVLTWERQREMRGTKGKWKGTDGKRRLRGVTEKDNKAGDRSA